MHGRAHRLPSTAAFLILALAIIFAVAGVASGRDLFPAPEPSHPEAAILPADEEIPFTSPLLPGANEEYERQVLAAFLRFAEQDELPLSKRNHDEIGGDDILVCQAEQTRNTDIAIASDGTIFVAAEVYVASTGYEIRIYRSTDGGTRFSLWGKLSDPSTLERFLDPSILACEGTDDRLFVAYKRYTAGEDAQIRLVYADLWAATATFSSEVTVMAEAGVEFALPRMATDSVSYSSYYLYLVAVGRVYPAGFDIWFARCTDRGTSFETAYKIGNLISTDRSYSHPDIAYGYGGWIHTTWHFFSPDHTFDSALRYRRVDSFAGGGDGSWEPMQALSGTSNGMDERDAKIAASPSSQEVVIGYRRLEWQPGDYYHTRAAGVLGSSDYGASFTSDLIFTDVVEMIFDIEYQASTEDFVALSETGVAPHLRRTDRTNLGGWSAAECLGDSMYGTGYFLTKGIAFDPTRGERVASAWNGGMPDEPNGVFFDAEWRADPGYPNVEPGFPLTLGAAPLSEPAIVDLDGDGNLETVFTDIANHIRAIQVDGTSLPGWPVNVGAGLSNGPVAIGAMSLTDQLSILVGTDDGRVFGYDETGAPLEGFPYQMPDAAQTYVSIGALGGPHPRMAVVVAGYRFRFIDYRAREPEGVSGWYLPGALLSSPAAIGDVDGDGDSEVVVAGSDRVVAVGLGESFTTFSRNISSSPSDAPTMGDVDLDGACEILVPCDNGTMYMLDEDGSDHAGWPVVTASGSPLTSAAIAQILLSYEPDIAWAARDWTVEAYYQTGSAMPGWPQNSTPGWYLWGGPVLDSINDDTGDVLIGDRGEWAWCWSNIGRLAGGWPKVAGDRIYLNPAVGDIDQDGHAEVVFLTTSSMIVVDVNNPPDTAHFRWPMYGHDPQRTGCHNCAEDLATPVVQDPDAEPGITRVSLSAPAPNPTSGSTQFSFAIPIRSQVRLDIFDVRGRRVRVVRKEEVDPGVHVWQWDGRDRAGQRLASGVYFAQLQVRGPGVNQTVGRKVNLLR